jgi:thiol:disulfide interchange protein DsbA
MKQLKTILFSALMIVGSIYSVQAQLLPPNATVKGAQNNNPTNTGFMEGLDYKLLSSPQPTESKGKIEVTEFFWYACPHCYDLEPEIQAWVKQQKNDVVFKRVPIAFRDDFLPHSQIFYTLEALGKEAEYSPKVMKAIHVDHKQLLKEDEIFSWAASVGLDVASFTSAYKSFSVITKAKTANVTGSAYRVNGVPTIFVQGKYETSPSIAGTKARTLQTLDYLVNKSRTEKK